jgi:hypothetical protein
MPTHIRHFWSAFIVTSLALLCLSEVILRIYGADNDPIVRQLSRALGNGPADAIVGDSHFEFDLGDAVPGFENLSIGGTNIPVMASLVHVYFRHKPIRRVIILASPQMFAGYRIYQDY